MYRLYHHAGQAAATNAEHGSSPTPSPAATPTRPRLRCATTCTRRSSASTTSSPRAGRHGCVTDRDRPAAEHSTPTRSAGGGDRQPRPRVGSGRVHYPWLAEAPALDRRFDLSDVERRTPSGGRRRRRARASRRRPRRHPVDARARRLEHPRSPAWWAGYHSSIRSPPQRALDRWCDEPIVGVRHLIHRDPDPDLLADPRIDDVLDDARRAQPDVRRCAESEHLLRLVPALAERHPNLTLVIDHLAKPPIASGGWQPWAAAAHRCRRGPEHGGQVVRAQHRRRTRCHRRRLPALRRPRARRVRARAHDVRRRLAVRAAGRQLVHRDLARPTGCLDDLDHADRQAVLAGTAQRVYRLSIPTRTATS